MRILSLNKKISKKYYVRKSLHLAFPLLRMIFVSKKRISLFNNKKEWFRIMGDKTNMTETQITLINLGIVLFSIILGYFLGSIPNALWIGKLFFKKDPRDYGSNNLGATNAGRLFGKKIGFLCVVLDMCKIILPVWAMWVVLTFTPLSTSGIIWSEPLRNSIGLAHYTNFFKNAEYFQFYYFVGLGSVIGHCFPIFAKFRGGKGFSCFIGLLFGVSWAIGLFTGLIYFIILKWKRYVSLASIACAIIGALLSFLAFIPEVSNIVFYGPTMVGGIELSIVLVILATFVVVRHRENIARLRNGNERKIKWMDSRKEKEARRLTEMKEILK